MKLLKAVLAFIIFQLLIAYINWDINPSNWSEPTRAAGVIFGLIFAVAVYAIFAVNTKEL